MLNRPHSLAEEVRPTSPHPRQVPCPSPVGASRTSICGGPNAWAPPHEGLRLALGQEDTVTEPWAWFPRLSGKEQRAGPPLTIPGGPPLPETKGGGEVKGSGQAVSAGSWLISNSPLQGAGRL